MNGIQLNGIYTFINLKVYFDSKTRSKSAWFDEYAQISDKHSGKDRKQFKINWKEKQKMITQNYALRDYRNLIVAGFIEQPPFKVNNKLFKVQIKNSQNQTTIINIWNDKIPSQLAKASTEDTILFRKVRKARPYGGQQSLNNNGAIYAIKLFKKVQNDDAMMNMSTMDIDNAKS